jgi:hypothetical protein
MRDLPTGLDLLELGRRLLLDDIAPLVPEARQRDLHLVATAIAITAREAAAGQRPVREIAALLENFYGADPADPMLLLKRLAADLRTGEFETSESRAQAARAILWRLTIAKLREGNPQFLAAHRII